MNKNEELKTLIEDGEILLLTKEETKKRINNFNYSKEVIINNVNKERFNLYMQKVKTFLNQSNLKMFIDTSGITIEGNCDFLESQIKKLKSLDKLASYLNEADLTFIQEEEIIKKNILQLLSYNDEAYLHGLKIYVEIIGISNFKEVFKDIKDNGYTNISAKFGCNGDFYFNISGDDNYLTLKGKAYYQSLLNQEIKPTTSNSVIVNIESNIHNIIPTDKNNKDSKFWTVLGGIVAIIGLLWGIYIYLVPNVTEQETSNVYQRINSNNQNNNLNIDGSGHTIIINHENNN